MDYGVLLDSVRNASKDELKKVLFELDSRQIQEIKELNLDDQTTKELIKLSKDHTFLTMLIINAMK